MSVLEEIRASVISGDAAAVRGGVDRALAAGIAPGVILNDALISAMTEVGDRFEQGEFYIPEMLIAARAMQAGLEPLRPLLAESGAQPLGRVAIGTVQGDLHDIGKNLVAMMLEGAGFEIMDLGTNAAPEAFVQAVSDGAQIVALSALLTTTMPAMKATIDALDAAGLRARARVLVGGAPVTRAFADQIGADGYSADASSAVRVAKQLLGV